MRATERFLLVDTENNINALHGPLEFPFILNALGWEYFYVGKQSWPQAIWAHTLAQTESGARRAPDDPAWRRHTIPSCWLRFPAHLWKGLRADTSLPRHPRWCEFNSWAPLTLLRYWRIVCSLYCSYIGSKSLLLVGLSSAASYPNVGSPASVLICRLTATNLHVYTNHCVSEASQLLATWPSCNLLSLFIWSHHQPSTPEEN